MLSTCQHRGGGCVADCGAGCGRHRLASACAPRGLVTARAFLGMESVAATVVCLHRRPQARKKAIDLALDSPPPPRQTRPP